MALDQYALTALATLKTRMDITASTDDAILEDCIDAASAEIEAYLGRKILSRSFVEWHPRQTDIRLRQRPITSMAGMMVGMAHAMTITSSVTTDTQATIAVLTDSASPTAILTRRTSDGTVTSNSINLATTKTTDALKTAIEAVTGFSATSHRNLPTETLIPLAAQDTVLGSTQLYAADTAIAGTIDMERGTIHIPNAYTYSASGMIWTKYTAGEATTPYEVEQIALELAAMLYHRRKADWNNQSSGLGGFSYNLGQNRELSLSVLTRLNHRRKIR